MKTSFKVLCPFWGIFLLIEDLLEEGITLHLFYHCVYSSIYISNTTKQHIQFSEAPEMHKLNLFARASLVCSYWEEFSPE